MDRLANAKRMDKLAQEHKAKAAANAAKPKVEKPVVQERKAKEKAEAKAPAQKEEK